MAEFFDQLRRKINLPGIPHRIISLVPSQTELLYDLGLEDEVIGITKFCIHPGEWFRSKPRIGGTKKINFEKIHELKPDLIIGNKEENDQSQVEELMKHYPVWMSDIKNLEGALMMIEQIGKLTGKASNSIQLKKKIEKKFEELQRELTGHKGHTVAYLIWSKPIMTAGHGTFIHDMLTRCGFINLFGHKDRYPEIKETDLAATDPDLILLSSEPFPFKEKHVEEFKAFSPRSKVMLVDGELFSWYGSRLLKSPDYFHRLVEEIKAGA